MKIKVTLDTSIIIDGKLETIAVGEHDLKESAAKILIDKGRAELVEEKKPEKEPEKEPETETKKQTKK